MYSSIALRNSLGESNCFNIDQVVFDGAEEFFCFFYIFATTQMAKHLPTIVNFAILCLNRGQIVRKNARFCDLSAPALLKLILFTKKLSILPSAFLNGSIGIGHCPLPVISPIFEFTNVFVTSVTRSITIG